MSALVYEIYDLNLDELIARIEKLNKRAARLGLPEILLREGVTPERVGPGQLADPQMSDSLKALYPDTALADIPVGRYVERTINGHKCHFRKLLVTIIGEPVVLTTEAADGSPVRWRLVAVLQHTPNGNIVRHFPDTDDIELDETWRTAEPHCIHCGTKRQRKDTFLLYSPKDGLIQIGRNCLSDFTGYQNPNALAQAAEWLSLYRDLTEGFSEDRFGDGGWQHLHTESFLAFVSAAIRQDGWMSRTRAQDEGKMATADSAAGAMWQTPAWRKTYGLPEPGPADFETARAAYAWVKDTLSQRERLSEYEWNLVMATQPYTSTRNIGLVASGLNAYLREQEKALKAKIEREGRGESQHVGQVGEKLELELDCVFVLTLDTQYGSTDLCKFVDASGNVFVWFSSAGGPEQGKRYAGKGTVKGHDVRDGVKQTILTRCKLTQIG